MHFLKAHKVFTGKGFLPEDRILVLNDQNLLKDVIPETEVENNRVRKLDGIVTPGFVNTHCHLELSHLKGKIKQHTGLPGFAKSVITQRNDAGAEERQEQMKTADRNMWNAGIVAVGDISNTEDSFSEKATGKLYYHTFIELIGLNPKNSHAVFEKGLGLFEVIRQYSLKASLSPHAPYSTSKELIQLISEHSDRNGVPLSIHNQESEEETKFFQGAENGFEDLYKSLNLDISWFKAPNMSSLQYYIDSLPDQSSILVHNVHTKPADLQLAKSRSVYWCFCPGANQYIESRLPDFAVFAGQPEKICIGTDSLAGNTQLDLVSEANLLLSATKQFSLENILQALTFNGAKALGIPDNYGQLIIGKNTGLNLIGLKNSQLQFIEKIA